MRRCLVYVALLVASTLAAPVVPNDEDKKIALVTAEVSDKPVLVKKVTTKLDKPLSNEVVDSTPSDKLVPPPPPPEEVDVDEASADFPQGFVTGHRIPIELFDRQTQDRLLAVEEEEDSPLSGPSYVDSSAFRSPLASHRLPPVNPHAPPAEPPAARVVSVLEGGLVHETDPAYFGHLDAFVPDYFLD
jgi:hypothetical protein